MGQMTRSEIVAQGLEEAGVDLTYKTQAETDLNKQLQRIYDAWPWPFLVRRASGVALGTGVTSLAIGAGSGGVAARIKRILDPIYLYNSDYSAAGTLRVRSIVGGALNLDENVMNPASFIGQSSIIKVRADTATFGKWNIIPGPVPNKAYLLAIDYIESPDPIATGSGGDSTKPLYPNDAVLCKIVECWALRHGKHETYQSERDVLAAMIVQDRVTYGAVDGINDSLPLDGSVFL